MKWGVYISKIAGMLCYVYTCDTVTGLKNCDLVFDGDKCSILLFTTGCSPIYGVNNKGIAYKSKADTKKQSNTYKEHFADIDPETQNLRNLCVVNPAF